MITPITRKELYLAKIIGEDVDIPETAKTREELFFLKILDNFSKIPEPITREELFLAKISGQDVELPEPKTRLELFLAKAAGVEIETPTPITREEIFWSNYSAIVDFEVEGVPPLTYKAIEGTLENYRIYGDTVDGESVGDRTGNLFYKKIENANVSSRGDVSTDSQYQYNLWIGKVTAGETYTARNMNLVVGFFTDEPDFGVYTYNNSRITDASPVYTFTVPSGCSYVAIRFFKNEPTIMLNSGSTPLPYEPYGYKVAVTVSNGTDTLTTPIYLPEQIKKVGDEAEYIDYAEQQFHRISDSDLDVTLPALPTLTGTNVLSVRTAVQPSKVYVKYKGERQ